MDLFLGEPNILLATVFYLRSEIIVFLNEVAPGKNVILKEILGGRRLRARLFSLGLIPGTRLCVLDKGGLGPVIVRVRDSSLALGQGMTGKIVVEAEAFCPTRI